MMVIIKIQVTQVIYQWNGSQWQQMGSDIDGENPNDHCGKSCLYFRDDGSSIIIGSYKNNDNGTNVLDILGCLSGMEIIG